MGSRSSQLTSKNQPSDKPKKDSNEPADYTWFFENYPEDIKQDSYNERCVTTTLPNDLQIENIESFVNQKFSDLDDDMRKQVKQLIMANRVEKQKTDRMSPSPSYEELANENNSSSKGTENIMTANANGERGINEYCADNSTRNSLSVRYTDAHKITVTLIKMQLEKSSTVDELQITVGYIKVTRQIKDDSTDMNTYWKRNGPRIQRALLHKLSQKFGK
ncbi:unnamed protein product [Adineta ricciae]|uniref:Uncharacterized protein n=1 Tax=Adineta ricciae TaxID=249248 RepID=A0A814JXP7_ADIRI|nr:unnamed protein product [Adineta ricciae]CAF1647331.1 unnamed protein product [Adineta ricciae]